MRAGDLDRRITIQREQVIGDDGYGNEIIGWGDVATVAAKVTQASGREFFAAASTQAEAKALFKLRWIDGITVIDRVVYEGRTYDIHEVKELGRREGLELHASTLDI